MNDLYSNSGAAPMEARPLKVANIREEARAAILVEQLSYLIEHAGSCTPECADCARMRRVEEALLEPFGVRVYPTIAPAA
jgi:hypothetical protein